MMKGKSLISLFLCFCLAGCTGVAVLGGAAAGIAGYKWYEGALEVIYQAPYIETWDAALRALEGMNLQIKSKEHDRITGRIEAKRADKDVSIDVKYKSSKETDVVIRVGLLGDKAAADAIHQEIRRELFGR